MHYGSQSWVSKCHPISNAINQPLSIIIIISSSPNGRFPLYFSACSSARLNSQLERPPIHLQCLFARPIHTPAQLLLCGNGLLDAGEECDCGRRDQCQDPCCDPLSCQLRAHAQCASEWQKQTEISSKILLPTVKAIKHVATIANFVQPGISADSSVLFAIWQKVAMAQVQNVQRMGTCWTERLVALAVRGSVGMAIAQTEMHNAESYGGQVLEKGQLKLMGKNIFCTGARLSDPLCFGQNARALEYGNCGTDVDGRFVECAPGNERCGLLQCRDGKASPVLANVTSFALQFGHDIQCKWATQQPFHFKGKALFSLP